MNKPGMSSLLMNKPGVNGSEMNPSGMNRGRWIIRGWVVPQPIFQTFVLGSSPQNSATLSLSSRVTLQKVGTMEHTVIEFQPFGSVKTNTFMCPLPLVETIIITKTLIIKSINGSISKSNKRKIQMVWSSIASSVTGLPFMRLSTLNQRDLEKLFSTWVILGIKVLLLLENWRIWPLSICKIFGELSY